MSFYNTTNETGQILLDFTSQAKSQKELVFDFFLKNPTTAFTWTDVANNLPEINEISLKRSITDLKTESLLIKTDEKAISKYGKPAYKYKLK